MTTIGYIIKRVVFLVLQACVTRLSPFKQNYNILPISTNKEDL